MAVLNQADGLFFYLGWPGINPPVAPNPIAPLNPGSIRPASLASITDGLSNTLAFGEKAHGKFSQVPDIYYSIDFYYNGAWVSGNFRRHAFHHDLSDEPLRPDRRRPQPQR